MDWPVLVLVGIIVALGAMAAWGWVRRREAIDADTSVPPPVEPVVIPVVEQDHPATTPRPPGRGGIVRGDHPAHPQGPGSATPGADGTGPGGWTIKGNAESGLYHTPASPSWKRMRAQIWFETEEAAEAAGFKRWDWRRTTS